jgi:hypothetical protein
MDLEQDRTDFKISARADLYVNSLTYKLAILSFIHLKPGKLMNNYIYLHKTLT